MTGPELDWDRPLRLAPHLAAHIAKALGSKRDTVAGAVIATRGPRSQLGRDVAGWLAREWAAGGLWRAPDGELWLFDHAFRQATKSVTKRGPGRRCAWCRKRFEAPAHGRPKLYCSAGCRQRAYEARRRADPAGHQRAFLADLRALAARAQQRKTEISDLETAWQAPASEAGG